MRGIKNYDLSKAVVLGSGSSGKTILVVEKQTQIPVALKIIQCDTLEKANEALAEVCCLDEFTYFALSRRTTL